MDNLTVGQFYRIKAEVEPKITKEPLKYLGTETYQGQVYHNFFNVKWGLIHWLEPDEVEPVEEGANG